MKLKHSTPLSCLAAVFMAAGAASNLNAFTYSDGDLLLVFRKATFNDVEFNLGTVSNYLGLANGTIRNVTNFNLTLVRSNFNNNLNGVTVSLLAITTPPGSASSRAWLTDPDPSLTRQDVTGSRFNSIWSKVNYVGVQATNNVPGPSSQVFVVSSSDPASYSSIVSSGGASDPSTLSGAVLFGVDGPVPSTLRFWELHVSSLNPKPDSLLVGSFTCTDNGVTFTAGNGGGGTAPTITSDPTNVTVFAGGLASFNVGASGATGYQWQFNDANISGATSASYNLTAHSTNAGGYRAIVSNASGSVTSTVATLTVNLPSSANLGGVSRTPGGSFQMNLTGTAGAYYEIQVNTNLATTNWSTIAFITNSGGTTLYSDPAATNSSQRFYRAVAR